MTEHKAGQYLCDEKKDCLGAGHFGAVHLGWHFQDVNNKVAIKLINLRKSNVKQLPSEMLGREMKILQDLSPTPHPNLVRLLSLEKTDDFIYLVMEYCRGGDMRVYLNTKGVLLESVIRQFFRQIGVGMKFLHSKNIIHRDLKPENILLNFNGERYPAPENIVLKIGDFGLGRYLPPDGCATTVCGTPNYMAPEIKPGKTHDKKVDLWSTGVMIYECLVGKEQAQELKERKFPVNASANIKDVIGKLLDEQPGTRLNFDEFLGHSFMLENMHVRVEGSGSPKTITVKKSSFVTSFIEKVRSEFNIDTESENIRLISRDIPNLELHCGSNSSLEDSGIPSGSTVMIVYKVSGGKTFLQLIKHSAAYMHLSRLNTCI